MMIGEKARAALYLFSFVLRTLYTLLALWDDTYNSGAIDAAVGVVSGIVEGYLGDLTGGLFGGTE